MWVAEPDDGVNPDEPEGQDPGVRVRARSRLARVLPILLWALTIATFAYAFIRVFGLEKTWLGYTLIAFTPYVAAASLVPLILAAVIRRKRAAIVGLVSTFALASVLVPRVVGHPDPVKGPKLRVMSANMKFGGADPATIVRLAQQRNVDVLALQEYTPAAQRDLLNDGLAALLPYSITSPQPSASGSAIYSRYPLTETGIITGPDWFTQTYATVHVPGARPVLMTSVHPPAPASPSDVNAWHTTLTREPAATPHGPVRVLIGDFNATLDHEVLRRLIGTGYHDAAAALGDGLATTWPYDGTPVPRVTLDHALVDPRIGVSGYQVTPIPNTDHRSIFVTLTIPRA